MASLTSASPHVLEYEYQYLALRCSECTVGGYLDRCSPHSHCESSSGQFQATAFNFILIAFP